VKIKPFGLQDAQNHTARKNYILETKFDAVNTPNAIEVYDKIPHFNSPQGDKYQ
jgi:hypothetical protein